MQVRSTKKKSSWPGFVNAHKNKVSYHTLPWLFCSTHCHISSSVQTHTLQYCPFEAQTTFTVNNAIFRNVVSCRSCVKWRFGRTYRLHLQGRKISEQGTSMSRLQQTQPPVENTQLYKNRGREGEWATWEINREERGRVCRDQEGRPGEQESCQRGKVAFCLSKSRNPPICSLKKPPEHDARSTRLCRSMHARQPEAIGSMLAQKPCLSPPPTTFLL
jgi:hypothetical protein